MQIRLTGEKGGKCDNQKIKEEKGMDYHKISQGMRMQYHYNSQDGKIRGKPLAGMPTENQHIDSYLQDIGGESK